MLKIGVLNAKGGVGKTLVATFLAVRFAQDYKRVALVDLDPQRGAHRWWSHRGETDNPTVFSGSPSASDAVESLMQTGWDIAIFDGAPGAMESTENAIQSVDIVVCPLRASDQDLGSTEHVVSACREFDTPLLLVINSTNPRGDKRATEVRELLVNAKLDVARENISQRVPFVDAMNVGKSAAEIKSGGEAKAEIESLYKDVMTLIRKNAERKNG